jgi:predicted phage terminase large subunit-like protein
VSYPLHQHHPTPAHRSDVTRKINFTDKEVRKMLRNVEKFSDDEVVEILKMVEEIERRKLIESCQRSLIEFCKRMMPDYLVGAHHRNLADLLMAIENGDEDRLTVSIAPRHGKSQMVSIFFIAWYLGHHPDHKIMLVSHTTDLAVDFGRKVRNLIATDEYQNIFPNTTLAKDSKSAGRWNTNQGGEFFACGVGSALAGRGANLLVIDDAHSEQDVLNGNFEIFEKAYQWYAYGARTRLMPAGAVVIVGTRWHQDDLIGRVVKDMSKDEDADQYTVVEFPAMMEVDQPDGTTQNKALWPEFFDLKALMRTKASMPVFQWNAQFQQDPTGEEGALVKREWWGLWLKDDPPKCDYVIMTLDAAQETHNRADYTAITTWGVFFNDDSGLNEIILLNAIKERYEFPELKAKALLEYGEWEPDSFIVEKKSAGAALYQELRRMGIPVSEFTPHRGSGDKTARLNSVTDIVKSGLCWVPRTRWAEELVDEVASFPFGSNDDLVDTTVMALMRFRQGGFLRLPSDEQDEPRYWKRAGKGYY